MEKQIEEMARTMCKSYGGCNRCMFFQSCDVKSFAMRMYDAGYRKQSEGEWISVDERLPEDGKKRVAVFLQNNPLIAAMGSNRIDTDRYLNGKWVRWGKWITHWMPLPEPPKGE